MDKTSRQQKSWQSYYSTSPIQSCYSLCYHHIKLKPVCSITSPLSSYNNSTARLLPQVKVCFCLWTSSSVSLCVIWSEELSVCSPAHSELHRIERSTRGCTVASTTIKHHYYCLWYLSCKKCPVCFTQITGCFFFHVDSLSSHREGVYSLELFLHLTCCCVEFITIIIYSFIISTLNTALLLWRAVWVLCVVAL